MDLFIRTDFSKLTFCYIEMRDIGDYYDVIRQLDISLDCALEKRKSA